MGPRRPLAPPPAPLPSYGAIAAIADPPPKPHHAPAPLLAVAALAVWHLAAAAASHSGPAAWGATQFPFLFLLAGFHFATHPRPPATPALQCFAHLAPSYYFALLCSLLRTPLTSHAAKNLALSIFMLQAWLDPRPAPDALNPPAWSAGPALLCVALVPPLLQLLRNVRQSTRILLLLPALWLLSAWHAYDDSFGAQGHVLFYHYLNWIPFKAFFPSFAFGVVLGLAFADRSRTPPIDTAAWSNQALVSTRLLSTLAILLLFLVCPLPSHPFLAAWAERGLLLPLGAIWVWSFAEQRSPPHDLLYQALSSRTSRTLGKFAVPMLMIHTAVLRNMAERSYSLCPHHSRLTWCAPNEQPLLNISLLVYTAAIVTAAVMLRYLVEEPGRHWIYTRLTQQSVVSSHWPAHRDTPYLLPSTWRRALYYLLMPSFLVAFFAVAVGGLDNLNDTKPYSWNGLFHWSTWALLPFLCSAIMLAINLTAHLLFAASVVDIVPSPSSPTMLAEHLAPDSPSLYFRIVTRGSNRELVTQNAARAWDTLRQCLPPQMFRIEVVTDRPLLLDERSLHPVTEILVPSDYKCPEGARFKARALHYAVSASTATRNDWIIHLDEETTFDANTVREIYRHVVEHRSTPVIAQGPVMYCQPTRHDSQVVNWFTTLGDSFRVADDFGKFRLQFHYGQAWLGMHGSYVVCPNSLEQTVGFDHGIEGSITEDAFFALLCSSKGATFRWLDAFMFEQSPFSVPDVVKQRSRWFGGLLLVCLAGKIPFRKRYILCLATLCWMALPLNWITIVMATVMGSPALETGFFLVLLGWSWAMVTWCYLLGFAKTFRIQDGPGRYALLLWLQLLLQPVHGIVEAWSVLYALFFLKNVTSSFHVVEKETDVRTEVQDDRDGCATVMV